MTDIEAHIAAADREIELLVAERRARGFCPHCLVAYDAFMRAAVRVRAAHAEAGLSPSNATHCSLTGLTNALAFLLINDLPADRQEKALAHFVTMTREVIAAPWLGLRGAPKTH